MAAHGCEVCGAEFDVTEEACPRCGEPVEDAGTDTTPRFEGLEARVTGRLRAIPPDDSDVTYRVAIVLALGYGVVVTAGLALGSGPLVSLGVVLLVGSLTAMYLDLLNLGMRLYGIRPILWVVGAVLMYFLVFPLYMYRRQRMVGSSV
jgi:hypothetical protein